jgi:DNA-binding protein HU-beta
VTKADIVDSLANGQDLSKRQAGKIVDLILDEITAALKAGDKVQLTPFGSFVVRERKARATRNPPAGEAKDQATGLAFTAPLGDVLTDEGRIDAKALARRLDVTVPRIARILGKSPQFLREYPTAPSVQPRALRLVDRVNSLAGQMGGLKYAIAWLKTPSHELGEISVLDALEQRFDVGITHIDGWLTMQPD